MDIIKLKEVMKKNHITQIDLAKMTGISLSAIRQIMCGMSKNPRYETIEKIEKALECFSDELSQPYLTTDEEKIIKTYRAQSERNKKLFMNFVDNMNELSAAQTPKKA